MTAGEAMEYGIIDDILSRQEREALVETARR
jgi:hypothetical protein